MAVKYMLDTNICIYVMKRRPEQVVRRFLEHDADEICLSAVTYAELMHGVQKSQAVERNRLALALFLSSLMILPFGRQAAEEYGKVRASLEKRGTPIGPLDMMIAAHARSEGLIVVTNNTREFERVEGLRLENWGLEK